MLSPLWASFKKHSGFPSLCCDPTVAMPRSLYNLAGLNYGLQARPTLHFRAALLAWACLPASGTLACCVAAQEFVNRHGDVQRELSVTPGGCKIARTRYTLDPKT